MWTWIKRRRALKFQLAEAITEAAQHHALATRLLIENSELRAIVVQLDAAVTDLSIRLYGRAAYDRAVDQHRCDGNN